MAEAWIQQEISRTRFHACLQRKHGVQRLLDAEGDELQNPSDAVGEVPGRAHDDRGQDDAVNGEDLGCRVFFLNQVRNASPNTR